MTVINPAAQFTPEDLLRLEGGDARYELVDGNLVEKNMSSLAGATTVIVSARLYLFTQQYKLGMLYSETSFQCFPRKPKQVRRPDIAFITTVRLAGVPREGHIPIRPDLAIEIVSAGDDVYDLDEKLLDYKSAQIPITWVFNPEQRLVRIYDAGRIRQLDESGTLSGEAVLPGFSIPVVDLFPEH